MSVAQKAYIVFLAAVFCAGMGRAVLMPPFEGVDETGHYSRILAAAFSRDLAKDVPYVARDVHDYYMVGPMSKGWIQNPTLHRNDPRVSRDGREILSTPYIDYHAFFGDAERVGNYRAFRARPALRMFLFSPEENWQTQHPPLYYALMGLVCRTLPDGISLPGRIAALRVSGFFLALMGFAAAGYAAMHHLAARGNEKAAAIAAFGAFYPFIMPSFFSDLTRLGNDTLALCLFGIAWVFLLRHLRRPHDWAGALGLGLALGLALLAKVTVLAPACGVLLFLLLRHGLARDWRALGCAGAAGVTAVLSCLVWYVPYFTHFAFQKAGLSGMATFALLLKSAGTISFGAALSSILNTLHGVVLHFSNWLGFTFPAYAIFLTSLPALWIAAVYGRAQWRDRRLLSDAMLPLWVLPPLLAGLAVHSVSSILINLGIAPTPGYYVHIAAPALAMLAGIGLTRIRDGSGPGMGHRMVALLGGTGIALTSAIFWLESQLYTGSWWKEDNAPLYLRDDTFADMGVTFERLAVLSWPLSAATFLLAALLLAGGGMALILRDGAEKQGAPSPSG